MKQLALVLAFGLVQVAWGVLPFELPQMNHEVVGTPYKSTDHPQGVFVIETYFLNCPYCHQNAPNVDELASHYKGEERVQVLDVGVDRNDSQYQQWIDQHQPNHPVLKDANRTLVRKLGTQGYPSAYVVDCKGNVVYKTSGVWNSAKKAAIRDAVDRLLESNPCAPEPEEEEGIPLTFPGEF